MLPNLSLDQSNGEHPQSSRPRKTRKVLDLRVFFGSLLAMAAVGTAAYFLLAFQKRHEAPNLLETADSLAKDHDYAGAFKYYSRYLELRPDDADARLRQAELFEQLTGGRPNDRTTELYQETLAPTYKGLSTEKRIEAERRLTQLMLQAGRYKAAEIQSRELADLEKEELKDKPGEWRTRTEGIGAGRTISGQPKLLANRGYAAKNVGSCRRWGCCRFRHRPCCGNAARNVGPGRRTTFG